MSLLNFIENYSPRTDKYDLGYIHEFYDKLFTPIKETTEQILEIGVYKGCSIKLWKDYFTNAHVTGIDVNHCESLDNVERVTHLVCDGYKDEFVSTLQDNFYDIVIDDGPHTHESWVYFIKNYTSKVKPGGFLIIEDIIDPLYTLKLLELIGDTGNTKVYNMVNKQQNYELKEKWSCGLDVIVLEKK